MNHQQEFLQFALNEQVLKFGSFTLKSGRTSPYFFNAGLFDTGAAIMQLGKFYAATIANSKIEFDILFGPAYKGIPLGAVTCACLAEFHGMNKGFSFNRKEVKTHGEGGNIIGAEIKGRVLIIDDVITAGTAIREAIDLISDNNAHLSGVVISLDRQEKGLHDTSAVQEIRQQYNVPVLSIAGLDNLIEMVKSTPELSPYQAAINNYRAEYGVS